MDVTQVRVFPVEEDKLKAFVSIIIDDCFVVSDIKIIQGNNGLFISMPSKKRKNGTFRDIAHPLNSETRRLIEQRVIEKYREVLESSGAEVPAEMRDLEAAAAVAEPVELRDPQELPTDLLGGGEGSWP
jgi:stage V sporulation protein G